MVVGMDLGMDTNAVMIVGMDVGVRMERLRLRTRAVASPPRVIKLNVGGVLFHTTASTRTLPWFIADFGLVEKYHPANVPTPSGHHPPTVRPPSGHRPATFRPHEKSGGSK